LLPCLVGVEACGTSHHWARELSRLGHDVRLMPAAYVKRGKNDAADAEAICEAVTRQTMRFVPIKSREQQAALSLHRVRSLLIKQRTQLVNMMRSVLAQLGISIPVGIMRALQMARQIVDGESTLDLPTEATNVVAMLAGQLLQFHAQLHKLDLRLAALQRSDDRARRLATIPGIGPIGATANTCWRSICLPRGTTSAGCSASPDTTCSQNFARLRRQAFSCHLEVRFQHLTTART
jgi:transposase